MTMSLAPRQPRPGRRRPRQVAGLRPAPAQSAVAAPASDIIVDRDHFNGLTRLIVRDPIRSDHFVINWLNGDQARQLAANLTDLAGGDR
jgi:hypothetical protein